MQILKRSKVFGINVTWILAVLNIMDKLFKTPNEDLKNEDLKNGDLKTNKHK